MGVEGSHCYFIILSFASSCNGVMLPYELKRNWIIARAATREYPLIWFSSGLRKTGSTIALMICCFTALSKLLDVAYSSSPRLCVALASYHCWGNRLAGRGGNGPGLGGMVNGAADTVKYAAVYMSWPRRELIPPQRESTLAAFA
jgi:hypothetical protein